MKKSKKVKEMNDIESDNVELLACKQYAKACIDIKTEIYALMANVHKEVQDRTKKYIQEALDVRAIVSEVIEDAKKVKKTIASELEKAEKYLNKQADALQSQREIEASEFYEIKARMDQLEGYIKNERFHDLVGKLNELEDEFHERAALLAQASVKNK